LNHIATPLAAKDCFTEKDAALSSILSVVGEKPSEYCLLILTSGEALRLGPALVAWSEQK
jgi:hypothetical protein